MDTPATQIHERPVFGTSTRPIGRSGSDLEPGCTTRSLEAEADQAQVLGAGPWRPVLVRTPPSLAASDAGAWKSGCAAGVEVDLSDVVLHAERAAAAYLEVRAAGMTAGGSFDEIDGAQAELRRAKLRFEQAKRGLAKRRIWA